MGSKDLLKATNLIMTANGLQTSGLDKERCMMKKGSYIADYG